VAEDPDGYVCLACSAPRVLVDAAVERAGSEKPLLERAQGLRVRRATLGAAAGVATAVGVVALVLGGAVVFLAGLGAPARALLGLFIVGPLGLAALGFAAVRRASAEIRATLRAAESAVTEDLIRARGPMNGRELAGLLRVSTERADELLARAEVERLLDSDVPRLRVDDSPPAEEDASSAPERRDRVR
jgi:hypothetical protein